MGTHRRDPDQTILIGGGRQEGRRAGTSRAGPLGLLGLESLLLEFSQVAREPMEAVEQESATLRL